MKKVIKWGFIVAGALIALIILALLIVPLFVDVEQYKPHIEKQVSEATGRPFTLGGDLNLSLFPWAGFSLSDLHLGNPPGFEEKDFVSVKSFEVRVKLLPLLSKDIQVKRFSLEKPRIVLERRKDGQGSWEGIGKPSEEAPPAQPEEKRKAPDKEPATGLPIKSLAVAEFAITDGSLLWLDHVSGERKEISGMTLQLQDVSLDRPIGVALSLKLDGNPLSLEGNLGPIGKEPGKGTIPMDLAVKALKELEMSFKGNIVNPVETPKFDLAVEVSPFSPRKLVAALGETFPVETADPKALDRVALKAHLKGDPENVSVSDGDVDLDESKLAFSVKAKDFSRPNVVFDLNLDEIDLDRYLPPSSEEKPAEEKKAEAPSAEPKKTDYTPLRRLVLDGTVRVGKLKASGARIEDVHMKVSGKNGLFHLDPITLKLYEGDVSSKGRLDVRQDIPQTTIDLNAQGIQVAPLLHDFLQKDFLEGTVKANVALSMAGDDPERIKNTLNGNGDFLFNDGAIVGINLAGMVQNVKATFGLAEKDETKPRTDFSELHAPFTITNGVVNTAGTSLVSPLLRVLAAGDANLVSETLNFRVEPKFVGTLTGQGDTLQRSGVTVPVLVTGTFSAPKFRPDLKGMLQKGVKEGLPQPSELKKLLPGQGTKEGEAESVEEKAKGLLKGLPFGK
jgi:AsmA protein